LYSFILDSRSFNSSIEEEKEKKQEMTEMEAEPTSSNEGHKDINQSHVADTTNPNVSDMKLLK